MIKNTFFDKILVAIVLFSVSSCIIHQPKENKNWTFDKTITLDSVGVISIAPAENGHFWLSDADNNQLLKIDKDGKIVEKVSDFERPMHLFSRENQLLIAEYGADKITTFANNQKQDVPFDDVFDAPSGVDKSGERIAVADFYNHRIVMMNGKEKANFGTKGKEAGQLTYPTDVQFANEKIYVADAYNHRVQVFDFFGKHLQTIGEAEKMNATTGIFINEKNIFATDFENNRIIIYDLNGVVQQIIAENLDKPTDVLVVDNQMFVTNYHGHSISIFKL